MNIIERDNNGLIKNINYSFDKEGNVDWRAMIKKEFLVINRQNFEIRKETIPDSIDNIPDKDLLILLSGIRNLAFLRGYKSYQFIPFSPSENCVIVSCTMVWRPNFETEGQEITSGAIGDATISNTNGFGKLFLGPIAENRAFIRCVKNFLRINILGQDELGPKSELISNESETQIGNNLLEILMNQYAIGFPTIKKTLVNDNFPGAESFTNITDIPRAKQLDLINRIKTKMGASKK